MKNIISILVILFCFVNQPVIAKDRFNANKTIKEAEKALALGDVYQAADLYEEVLRHEKGNKEAAFTLGTIYYKTRDYVNAGRCFELAANSSNKVNNQPLAGYYLGLMQKMNGKYEEAKKTLEAFKKSFKTSDSKFDKKWIDKEIEGCVFAINQKAKESYVDIIHPGNQVNSSYSDFGPTLLGSDTLLFCSLRSDTVIIKTKTNHFVNLFTAVIEDKDFKNLQPFKAFDFKGKHVSNPVYVPEIKTMFLTICEESKDGDIQCKIYRSKWNGTWSEPVALGESVNNPNATNTQPAYYMSPQGKAYLYFVSNREGGKGGNDIWFASIDKSGNVGDAKNCGSKINTNRDEETPYVDPKSGALYFSSTGHKSVGGFDIFKSIGAMSNWSAPENIGVPINSPADDKYYVPYKENRAFLVSNRVGIQSIRSETCCPDIFMAEFKKVIHLALTGKVFGKSDTSKAVELDKAKIVITELDTASGEEASVFYNETYKKGKAYFTNLQFDKEYKITAYAEGYLSSSVSFNTYGINNSDTLIKNLTLSRIDKSKSYRLSNIYYDFDKANLREGSKKTLDSLYQIMMENQQIIVELSSHTDSRGTAEYNEDLSQRRAESCVNYLIEKGIPKNRISPKGYGESKLLDDCTKYPECPAVSSGDCDCHQRNRRTEFRIVGELEGIIKYDE